MAVHQIHNHAENCVEILLICLKLIKHYELRCFLLAEKCDTLFINALSMHKMCNHDNVDHLSTCRSVLKRLGEKNAEPQAKLSCDRPPSKC